MRTDTVAIPRVIITSTTLEPERPAHRAAWAFVLLALLVAGITLAVAAGQTVAYREPAPVVEQRGGLVHLELPCCAVLNGTDAGLVTTPAGDQ